MRNKLVICLSSWTHHLTDTAGKKLDKRLSDARWGHWAQVSEETCVSGEEESRAAARVPERLHPEQKGSIYLKENDTKTLGIYKFWDNISSSFRHPHSDCVLGAAMLGVCSSRVHILGAWSPGWLR